MSETTSYGNVSSVESVESSSTSSFGLADLIGGLVIVAGAGLVAAAQASSRHRARLDSPAAVRAAARDRQPVRAATPAAARRVVLDSIQGMAIPKAAAGPSSRRRSTHRAQSAARTPRAASGPSVWPARTR